ncbi:Phosphate import ATP-binding protein PstB [Trichinella spiralis]|uniref:Phosphate import ATP-binding protein PstB n=1 Tax=Trichinella spiralis TaxID=6334 RepID=A0ABR3KI70_TRISP
MSQTQGKPRTVEALEDLLKDLGVEEQEQASDMAGNSVITASDVRIARTLSEHVIEKMPNSLLNIIEEVNSRKLNAQKSSSPMPAEGVLMVEPNYCVKPNSFDFVTFTHLFGKHQFIKYNRNTNFTCFMAKVVFVLGPPGCALAIFYVLNRIVQIPHIRS